MLRLLKESMQAHVRRLNSEFSVFVSSKLFPGASPSAVAEYYFNTFRNIEIDALDRPGMLHSPVTCPSSKC